MKKINKVIEILRFENINSIIKQESFNNFAWNRITWIDSDGDECSIFEDNIAIDDGKIAWFQSSKRDNHILKIYENDEKFSWIPITYNPFFGCICLLMEWYRKYLIFIYQEKHDIYICSIKNNVVNYFNFHGEEIERKGNIISYDTYTNKPLNKVRLIKIPELEELEAIDKPQAEILGLLPVGLNRPGNFLGLK